MHTEMEWKELEFDLATFCEASGRTFPIDAIYLFGSRRFNTDCVRSDIDLFFETREEIKHSKVRSFIDKECKALDVFLLDRGKAVSVVNESHIRGGNNREILKKCGAAKLWSRNQGLVTEHSNFCKQMYASHVEFHKTTLPNAHVQMSFDELKKKLSKEGLPSDPILGETEDEVAGRLVKIARAVTEFRVSDFPGQGSASQSFVASPASEYDYQDLFWIATKPWIPSIDRECVEIVFDGQRKKSDFSILGSRFIIEMKLAKNKDDKRKISNVVEGLTQFYSENANVRFLLFIVYASKDAEINRTKWEDRYSKPIESPRVVVKVIRVD